MPDPVQIFFLRGAESDCPTLAPGEPYFALDTGRMFVGSPSGNIPVSGTGPPGPEGPAGAAATVAAGTTTTGAAGTSASVANSGTTSAAVFDFTIPRGDTGAAGAAGANGTNGSVWYSGSGAPAAGTGANGDYYFRTSTGDVYGPKAAGSWGSPVANLTGPQGTPGVDFLAPVGAVILYASSSRPSGWLQCDGTSVLRSTYADLFAVIGTTFGAVDGTHFNVPNLNDRFVRGENAAGSNVGTTGGATTVTIAQANLPAINLSGFFVGQQGTKLYANPGSGSDLNVNNQVPLGGSGTALSILPSYLTLQYMIRHAP